MKCWIYVVKYVLLFLTNYQTKILAEMINYCNSMKLILFVKVLRYKTEIIKRIAIIDYAVFLLYCTECCKNEFE